MNILAIDCACSVFSVALLNEEKMFYKETDTSMKQSELIIDFINDIMGSAKLTPKDLGGILCMAGPGSFTGLRIGYSVAKSLALSLSIPFASVSTLECIALYTEKQTTTFNDLIMAVIEARKNAFFYAFFNSGKRLTPDKDGSLSQIIEDLKEYIKTKKIILTGNGASLLYDSLSAEFKDEISLNLGRRGYAKELITIAKNNKILDNDCTAFLYSGPEYIRLSDAELNQI